MNGWPLLGRLAVLTISVVSLALCVALIVLILSDYGIVGIALGFLLLTGITLSYLRLRHEVHRGEMGTESNNFARTDSRRTRALGLLLILAGGIGLVASAAFTEGLVNVILIAIFSVLLIGGLLVRTRGHLTAAIDRAVRLRRGMRTKD